MLCAVITGPSEEAIKQQIEKATPHADLLELRWDCFDSLDFIIKTHLPMIFTLRSRDQGGYYKKSEESRFHDIERLLDQKPKFLDLEYYVSSKLIETLREKYPKIEIILSYHDFDKTPYDLNEILLSLKEKPADFYKIATMANSTIDALRMMIFSKNVGKNVIGLCMGELGMPTRILNHFTYASLEENSLPHLGQISIEDLIHRYRFKSINNETAIYGLIGDPINKSPSHVTHNDILNFYGHDAVYIKMNVKKEELETFFKKIKHLNIKGLSVTMPLKEAVISYLDGIDSKAHIISAVNTIVVRENQLFGFNTDCTGALMAIEDKTSVKNKIIIILGAGGAARAIAYEAKLKGADVTILNRTTKKAYAIASDFNCRSGKLTELETLDYDILINCTSDEMPISADLIKMGSIVMEIKHTPKWTNFLIASEKQNCTLIFGYEMFVNQAAHQFRLWFKYLKIFKR
jgi:3-dehydroquinate dehydratase/shikimate dehydrogenase